MKQWLFAAAALLGMGASSAAQAWWNDDFAYRKEVTITAPAGAADLRAPILVRLDSSNFRFEDADAQGRDLRFIGADDRTPLAHHVERFDARTGLAFVWVDAPKLSDKVYLYYGAKRAEAGKLDALAPAQTYDASYRTVLHFGESAGAVQDMTANRTSVAGDIARVSASAIGRGARFDGAQVLTLAPGVATAIDPARGFSFEAWIKPDANSPAANSNGVLYEARDGASALAIGLANGALYVESNGQRMQSGAPIASEWTQLLVSGNSSQIALYVNGRAAGTLAAGVPALPGAARIGAGFAGDLDEVRIAAAARSAPYAQALFASEGRGGKLLSFGADEEPSGHGFGYFGVIFANITLDAWVVIGILSVMAVLSWVVMYVKGGYVARTARANERFANIYRSGGGRIEPGLLSDKDRKTIADSSLQRLYLAGVAELEERKRDNGGHLSEEGLDSVRAALDAALVDENQRLDRWMVLLTIAISGGPFIGLLGTVLGVMITFAAIALEGDVNVNAIAPGVAAALLATVAGLAVAIPALFGYNFIATRNGDAAAKMQVFCDRLAARFAVNHARVQRAAAE